MPLLASVQQEGSSPALRLPGQMQLVDVSQVKLACCLYGHEHGRERESPVWHCGRERFGHTGQEADE